MYMYVNIYMYQYTVCGNTCMYAHIRSERMKLYHISNMHMLEIENVHAPYATLRKCFHVASLCMHVCMYCRTFNNMHMVEILCLQINSEDRLSHCSLYSCTVYMSTTCMVMHTFIHVHVHVVYSMW